MKQAPSGKRPVPALGGASERPFRSLACALYRRGRGVGAHSPGPGGGGSPRSRRTDAGPPRECSPAAPPTLRRRGRDGIGDHVGEAPDGQQHSRVPAPPRPCRGTRVSFPRALNVAALRSGPQRCPGCPLALPESSAHAAFPTPELVACALSVLVIPTAQRPCLHFPAASLFPRVPVPPLSVLDPPPVHPQCP